MTVRAEPHATPEKRTRLPARNVGIDLYWLPLGAGGNCVRLNGRVYELLHAFLDRRRPLDLYHSALEVTVPEGRFVIENSWPIPNTNRMSRGVTVEGQSEVATSVASGSFATRCGGGARARSLMRRRRWQAHGA